MRWSRSARRAASRPRRWRLPGCSAGPAVTSLVIGGRNEAQFKDNIAAAELKLTDDERARLDEVSQPPLLYPYWHQQWTARDRFGEADKVMDRTS